MQSSHRGILDLDSGRVLIGVERSRSRVITEGVVPSLHVDYKSSRIKQYHKEGRALRTETAITIHATSGSANNSRTCPFASHFMMQVL